MKTAIELRSHILAQIGSSGANLLGTRTYPSAATKYAFTAAGDVVTVTGTTFTNGDAFKLFGSNLPSPLTENVVYYFKKANFKNQSPFTMNKNHILLNTLRIVGLLEGISYLLLLFIAMPLKYFFQLPQFF